MRVGGTFPYAKLESHSDLGSGAAGIRWRRAETQQGRRKASRNFVPGTMQRRRPRGPFHVKLLALVSEQLIHCVSKCL